MRRWLCVCVLIVAGCTEGEVVPLSGSPDAPTTDALVVAPDVGAPIDVGFADAEAPDAGQVDMPDVSFPDAVVDAGFVDAAPADAGATPVAPLDELTTATVYLNLGDSVGAGFNAGNRRGYAHLLFENHRNYPAYATHDLSTRFPGVRFVNRAESGATSNDLSDQTQSLPDPQGGDAVVTIHVGGNDFNDDIRTMLSSVATMAVARRWQRNTTAAIAEIRSRYEGTGRNVIIVLSTIYDPTDGMGTIPDNFNQGFCRTLKDPRFVQAFRTRVLGNLAAFNDAIRDLAASQDVLLLDTHRLFTGHGMNAFGADRWIDTDCAHANDEGHHQMRRELWWLLTGRRY